MGSMIQVALSVKRLGAPAATDSSPMKLQSHNHKLILHRWGLLTRVTDVCTVAVFTAAREIMYITAQITMLLIVVLFFSDRSKTGIRVQSITPGGTNSEASETRQQLDSVVPLQCWLSVNVLE